MPYTCVRNGPIVSVRTPRAITSRAAFSWRASSVTVATISPTATRNGATNPASRCVDSILTGRRSRSMPHAGSECGHAQHRPAGHGGDLSGVSDAAGEASGIETPTRDDLARLDRKRKKKTSNKDWTHPWDPVGIELAVLALNPRLSKVARRQTFDLG